MINNLKELSIPERIQIVEDLWDSIADDQNVLVLTYEQQRELDRRLEAYHIDNAKGRLATEVITGIRNRL